jgi:hypothetical protein
MVSQNVRDYIAKTFNDGFDPDNLRCAAGECYFTHAVSKQVTIVTAARLKNDLGIELGAPAPESASDKPAEPTKPAPAPKADGKTDPAKS